MVTAAPTYTFLEGPLESRDHTGASIALKWMVFGVVDMGCSILT